MRADRQRHPAGTAGIGPSAVPASDAIAEMDAGDERYGIDSRAVRRCPACGLPGRLTTDAHGRRVVEFTHASGCWLHGTAARVDAQVLDEAAYLDGTPHPFERDEGEEPQ